jgi:hypothetical protein
MRTDNIGDDLSEEEMALVAAGIMRLPINPRGLERLLEMPRVKVEGNAATQALLEERYADDAR